MAEKKESRAIATFDREEDLNGSVDEYVDAIMEGMEEGYQSDLEPFEAHVQRIRQEFHDNIGEFRDTFLEGYEVLMEELTNLYGVATEGDDPLPPNAIKL